MTDQSKRLDELKIERDDYDRSGPGAFTLASIAVLLLAVGVGGWWWLGRDRVATVEVAAVETVSGDVAAGTVLDASGYVTARRRATVSSKITGKIVEVLIEEGMEVEEGQVLARLDDSSQTRAFALAEAELAEAKSALTETEVRLAEARRDHSRVERLVAANVATTADLDNASAEVDSLEARLGLGREQIAVAERRLEVRRQELADTVIRSPFDGVVVTKNAQPGEMISPVSAGGGFTRTGIGTVVDMSSLEIEVDVNEAYIQRVRPEQEVVATLDAYPDWQIPAKVITSVPTADRQKATVQVRIGFDQLDRRILPDMGVKVGFLDDRPPTTEVEKPRWRIPDTALRRDGDQDIVFVFRDDEVERRAVRIGRRDSGMVTIVAGLTSGEQVVVAGPEDLADGSPAKIE